MLYVVCKERDRKNINKKQASNEKTKKICHNIVFLTLQNSPTYNLFTNVKPVYKGKPLKNRTILIQMKYSKSAFNYQMHIFHSLQQTKLSQKSATFKIMANFVFNPLKYKIFTLLQRSLNFSTVLYQHNRKPHYKGTYSNDEKN